MEGVRTWAGDFRALLWDVGRYLLLKDPLLCSDWCLEIRGKEMTKHGGHEWKARGLKCSLDLELLITLSWIPHLSFELKRLSKE